MKFTIYGDSVTITNEMREKIEDRLSFLNKYLIVDENTNARVTVKDYCGSLKVEVTIPTKVALLRGEVNHKDFSTAVDLAIDKIEDQIRRQKGRLSRRHKESLIESFMVEEDEENGIPVKTKTVYADELVLDEAIIRMEMLGHSFFVYKDVDSGKISVVYKREDGNYGLLEVSD